LLVDLSAVRDVEQWSPRPGVIQQVNDTVIVHADAPLVFVPSELLASCRSGIVGKRHNLAVYPRKQRIVEPVKLFLGRSLNVKGEPSLADEYALRDSAGTGRKECSSPCGAIRPRAIPEILPNGVVFLQIDEYSGLAALASVTNWIPVRAVSLSAEVRGTLLWPRASECLYQYDDGIAESRHVNFITWSKSKLKPLSGWLWSISRAM
jgi:hypothetical protein